MRNWSENAATKNNICCRSFVIDGTTNSLKEQRSRWVLGEPRTRDRVDHVTAPASRYNYSETRPYISPEQLQQIGHPVAQVTQYVVIHAVWYVENHSVVCRMMKCDKPHVFHIRTPEFLRQFTYV